MSDKLAGSVIQSLPAMLQKSALPVVHPGWNDDPDAAYNMGNDKRGTLSVPRSPYSL